MKTFTWDEAHAGTGCALETEDTRGFALKTSRGLFRVIGGTSRDPVLVADDGIVKGLTMSELLERKS